MALQDQATDEVTENSEITFSDKNSADTLPKLKRAAVSSETDEPDPKKVATNSEGAPTRRSSRAKRPTAKVRAARENRSTTPPIRSSALYKDTFSSAFVHEIPITKATQKGNAPQIAQQIGAQSRAFQLELFQELMKYPAAFFRLGQCLLKANTVTDVEDRFRKACQGVTSRQQSIYDYLVPADLRDYNEDFDGLQGSMLARNDDLNDTEINEQQEKGQSSDRIAYRSQRPYPLIKLKLGKPDPTTALMDAIDLEVFFRRGARPDSEKEAIISSVDTKQWRASRIRLFENGIERQTVRAHNKRYDHKPLGRRSIDCVRNAFDVLLCRTRGPSQPWRNSDDFFMKTLEFIDTDPDVCLIWTEPDSDEFLHGLRIAMDGAEKRHAEEWLLSRSEEDYADLLGCERGTRWSDDFYWFEKTID